jgi:uncharacterized protein (DUF427 family)
MAVRVSESLPLDRLRFEPTPKRVRAVLGGETLVDTRRALLVWEAGNVVPGYSVPMDEVRAELLARLPADAVRRYDDAELGRHVGLRFSDMDAWYEEEEEIFGHPRDPFQRVDVRRSSRHVRVELDGVLLAESRTPHMLFETGLPVRFYLSRADVRMDLLEPSDTRTTCAYKGCARHFSARVGGELRRDVAWTYLEPLPDSAVIRDLVAFYGERVDLTVDGERLERPLTQWS